MNFAYRKRLYRRIEADRDSKVVTFVTSDRSGLETQIAPDCVNLFVELLDKIGPTSKISLILHTNGGHTASAWRIVNLINTFCDELEVLIPLKAMSAGTLISLGADRLVMTKQAALGPIDPSLTHALSPQVNSGGQMLRVPVSVEAVRGYLDAAKGLGVTNPDILATVLMDLSKQLHPLVLGEIFRSREQIRYLADRLLGRQVTDAEKKNRIIDFLCADSGSHDYTINRREAVDMGLNIEKPSQQLYDVLKRINDSYTAQLKLLEPYSPQVALGANQAVQYLEVRGLVESTDGGCYGFVSEGSLTKTLIQAAPIPQEAVSDQRTFEGWRKLQ